MGNKLAIMDAQEAIEGLNKLSQLVESAKMAGNITKEQYNEAKGKIRESLLDNFFTLMASVE